MHGGIFFPPRSFSRYVNEQKESRLFTGFLRLLHQLTVLRRMAAGTAKINVCFGQQGIVEDAKQLKLTSFN